MNILLAFTSLTRETTEVLFLTKGRTKSTKNCMGNGPELRRVWTKGFQGCRQRSGRGAAEPAALCHGPGATADLHPRQRLCQRAAGPTRQTDLLGLTSLNWVFEISCRNFPGGD